MERCALYWLAVSALFAGCLAETVEMEMAPDVEIVQRPQFLYSTISPKLRIQGKGFGKVPGDIHLSFIPALSTKGTPMYNLSCTDTAMSIGLKKGNSWPQPSPEGSTIFVQSLVVDSQGAANQLSSPIAVATVISAPSVMRAEDRIIYMTGTNRFLINGTGFREGSMSLTFDPPLVRDVDYVLAVRSSTVLQLALKTGRTWRSDGEPGPLRLRRIDSGAGALRIDPKFGGVIVAEVQVDLGGHGVTAVANPSLLVYQNHRSIVVSGEGFEHCNTISGFGPPRLRWGNGLLGRGVNYSTSEFDDSRVELVLKPGSLWRRNGANLPAPLTLLAADVGSGLVAIGATEARKGITVATVFESPVVNPQPLTSLFRTHSAQLWITGVGFTRAGATLGVGGEFTLDFEPPLQVGTDYMLTVFNRTHALVRLREGRAWAPEAGPLYVTGMDAGAGPYENFKPAAVAHVIPDADSHPSGVEVTRTNHQVLYQTPAIRHLEVHGASLSTQAQLVFDPPLKKNVDYTVLRATSELMVLSLLPGKMWRHSAGPLFLTQVETTDGHQVDMALGTGIVVADVAANPTVATSPARVTVSTTRRLSIYGTGFSIDGTELTLEPTSRSSYEVEAVYENEVVLRLKEGHSWGALGKDQQSGLLLVTKIDTAAGEYVFQDADGKPRPVLVATLVSDALATTASGGEAKCDDTCMWANDGVCDDGSQSGRGGRGGGGGQGSQGARDKGEQWWEDDDLGGFYSDEYDDEERSYDGEYDYGYEYDDSYGYYGDDAAMPACLEGTDCTDCGGPVISDDASLDLATGAGSFDDDGWFDDDTEEWWDDDYDFGDEWDGFEDDEKDTALGIVQSLEPARAVNKRHNGIGRHNRNEKHKHHEGAMAYPKLLFAFGVFALLLLASCARSICAPKRNDKPPATWLAHSRKTAQA